MQTDNRANSGKRSQEVMMERKGDFNEVKIDFTLRHKTSKISWAD